MGKDTINFMWVTLVSTGKMTRKARKHIWTFSPGLVAIDTLTHTTKRTRPAQSNFLKVRGQRNNKIARNRSLNSQGKDSQGRTESNEYQFCCNIIYLLGENTLQHSGSNLPKFTGKKRKNASQRANWRKRSVQQLYLCHVPHFSLAPCCRKLRKNEDGLGAASAEHPPGYPRGAFPAALLLQEGPQRPRLSQHPRRHGEPSTDRWRSAGSLLGREGLRGDLLLQLEWIALLPKVRTHSFHINLYGSVWPPIVFSSFYSFHWWNKLPF